MVIQPVQQPLTFANHQQGAQSTYSSHLDSRLQQHVAAQQNYFHQLQSQHRNFQQSIHEQQRASNCPFALTAQPISESADLKTLQSTSQIVEQSTESSPSINEFHRRVATLMRIQQEMREKAAAEVSTVKQYEGNFVTPPPSVAPPSSSNSASGVVGSTVRTNSDVTLPSKTVDSAPVVSSIQPDPSSAAATVSTAYQQHLLNLSSILQQQSAAQQPQQSSSAQTSAHLLPLLGSLHKFLGNSNGVELSSSSTGFQQVQGQIEQRPQLALNQLIGNHSTVSAVSSLPSPTISSSTSPSTSSMLFSPTALQAVLANMAAGNAQQSPQWLAALSLLQQQMIQQPVHSQQSGPENVIAELQQLMTLRAQQQLAGASGFTSALAELQNRQQQVQSSVAAASKVQPPTNGVASTSATPLTPDHVGDVCHGDFARSMEKTFAPTADTLNILNDNRHPQWMSPPLSSHTPASSASPMLFAVDDNSDNSMSRLPSTGTHATLGSEMLTSGMGGASDRDTAFSDISSTCSGSPPPRDVSSTPIPAAPVAVPVQESMLSDSSVFTTPPTDSTAKPMKKTPKKPSKKTTGIHDTSGNDSSTTPLTSRKRISDPPKPRETAATKRARIAAAAAAEDQLDELVNVAHPIKKSKVPKKKKSQFVTSIVPRKFSELSENESIAVRVLAGLANGHFD